jgi:tungstate transport system substrate-binding protein
MRERNSLPGIRRAAAVVLAAVVVFAIAAPAVASAAARKPTLSGISYMSKAKRFTLSGSIGRGVAGRVVTIQVQKPGRPYWVDLTTRTATRAGRFSYKYVPKLAGRYSFRAVYGRASRNKSLRVRRSTGAQSELILFSTTSVRDSGLWKTLKPAFLARCPEYTMTSEQWLGTGQSLTNGAEMGQADVILAHAPQDEMRRVAQGYAKNRRAVMLNYFMIVGPATGGATFDADASPITAFQAIATWLDGQSTVEFWSRNDDSGTNQAEKAFWLAAGNPQGSSGSYKPWYNAATGTGVGMSAILNSTNTKAGYTLADRATWLFQEKKWRTGTPTTPIYVKSVLYNPGAAWVNDYSVLEVTRARNPEGAADFSAWIRTAEAQALIRTYGAGEYTGQLFYPNAGAY